MTNTYNFDELMQLYNKGVLTDHELIAFIGYLVRSKEIERIDKRYKALALSLMNKKYLDNKGKVIDTHE
jgi:hypothetical protein